jgi:hypothetical protein
MAALLEHLRVRTLDEPSQHWLAVIRAAYAAEHQRGGGMSGWFMGSNDKPVECLQADFDSMNHIVKVWVPGVRNAAWNPLGVRFFTDPTQESDRRFYGVLTLASDDETYVGYDKNWMQVLVYHRVDEKEKV